MAMEGTIFGTAGGGGRRPYVIWRAAHSGGNTVITFTPGSNAVSSYYTNGTFSGTLYVAGSGYAVSGSVPANTNAHFPSKTITFSGIGAKNISVSLSGSIPGTTGWKSTSLSATITTNAGIAAPAMPTNFAIERTGVDTATLSFTKGARAEKTEIQAKNDTQAWYVLATPTGSTHTVRGLKGDRKWEFSLQSQNAGGRSAWTEYYVYYTKPLAPSAPVLGANKSVSWTKQSRYAMGYEVRRTDNGGSTYTTPVEVEGTSWTDPNAQAPTTQYEVRTWAGPSHDGEAKTYSDWSEKSKSWLDVNYEEPKILTYRVERWDSSTNQAHPMGTSLRLFTSGTATKVPNALGVETNKLTRQFQWRLAGAPSWTNVAVVTNVNADNWAEGSGVTVVNNLADIDKVYETRLVVTDTYTPSGVTEAATIPVAATALSLAKEGAGIGKIWERGALDVGGDAYVAGSLHLADPNEIVINGVAYRRSGSWTTTTGSGTAWEYLYYTTVPIPAAAKNAPPGYIIQYAVQRGGNGSWWAAGANDSGVSVMLVSASAMSRTVRITWQLVKLSV